MCSNVQQCAAMCSNVQQCAAMYSNVQQCEAMYSNGSIGSKDSKLLWVTYMGFWIWKRFLRNIIENVFQLYFYVNTPVALLSFKDVNTSVWIAKKKKEKNEIFFAKFTTYGQIWWQLKIFHGFFMWQGTLPHLGIGWVMIMIMIMIIILIIINVVARYPVIWTRTISM